MEGVTEGTRARGVWPGTGTLTDEQIHDVRRRASKCMPTLPDLADRFGPRWGAAAECAELHIAPDAGADEVDDEDDDDPHDPWFGSAAAVGPGRLP
jgi:hypothetical protein